MSCGKKIDDYGEIRFNGVTGVTSDNFLELLDFYLHSTVVNFEGKHYAQRSGICIGSSLAPILSDLFLSAFDSRVSLSLDSSLDLTICRYVDDYLVVVNRGLAHQDLIVKNVINTFSQASKALKFTCELPCDNKIRFLDLQLSFRGGTYVCWQYSPRAQKQLLRFNSAHSKLVKRGVAMTCIQEALKKSCVHKVEASFHDQILRLSRARFPSLLISSVCEALLQKMRRKVSPDELDRLAKRKKVHVIPYLHRVSHNVNKMAQRYGVNVVFSAPEKLSKVCPLMSKNPKKESEPCAKNHAVRYTDCRMGVVYEIPLSCKRVYIGQTGRCFNERAREHNWAVENKAGGHLSDHCKRCKCSPLLDRTKFLRKARGRLEREIMEALFIRQAGDNCVSTPSLSLTDKEVAFLNT